MNKVQWEIDYFTHPPEEAGQRTLGATSEPARLARQELARLYREQLLALHGTLRDDGGLPSEDKGSDNDG